MSWIKKAASGQISWEIVNKNLVITITPEYQKELAEHPEISSDDLMYEVLEPLTSNGFEWVRPEEIAALTSAPIIGEVVRDDHGELTKIHTLFWYPDYAVRSPVQVLAEKGTVTFDDANEEMEEQGQARNDDAFDKRHRGHEE